ncbi:hypothetical protein [Rhizobium sp. L43]|uniref:hypothetical protein n=1 Tax=Rhizobium sp. L43 TaxID=2035452 RepID=UPI00117B77F8|nr:hypothetical protein [Rhizobium sp. L43]
MCFMITAADFQYSLGVNIHIGFKDTSYKNIDRVIDNLDYLGITNVRDHVPAYDWMLKDYNKLADAGIKMDLVLTPVNGSYDLPSNISYLKKIYMHNSQAVRFVEGANEVLLNNYRYKGGNHVSDMVGLQRDLYNMVHQIPLLGALDVLGLTGGGTDKNLYASIGDLSPYADYANVHYYSPFGVVPGTFWAQFTALDKSLYASKNHAVMSETGYNTFNDQSGVSEKIQAVYGLETILRAKSEGYDLTYLYELQDQKLDGEKATRQNHYGLFNFDGTPKLAAIAIHNFMEILKTGPSQVSPAVDPALDRLKIEGLGTIAQTLIINEENGAYDLVIWRNDEMWDYKTHSEIDRPKRDIVVTFGTRSNVRVYDPLHDDTFLVKYDDTSKVSVTLGNAPIIMEFIPAKNAL